MLKRKGRVTGSVANSKRRLFKRRPLAVYFLATKVRMYFISNSFKSEANMKILPHRFQAIFSISRLGNSLQSPHPAYAPMVIAFGMIFIGVAQSPAAYTPGTLVLQNGGLASM